MFKSLAIDTQKIWSHEQHALERNSAGRELLVLVSSAGQRKTSAMSFFHAPTAKVGQHSSFSATIVLVTNIN
jgi:hypothetical protein